MIHLEPLERRTLLTGALNDPLIERAGSLDPAFGQGGVSAATGPIAAVQANGRILFWDQHAASAGLEALRSDGSPDAAFDQVAAQSVPSGFHLGPASVTPNEEIIVGGGVNPNISSGRESLAILRLNPDGSADASFGNNGVAVLPVAIPGSAVSGDNGRILVTSAAGGKVLVLYYDSVADASSFHLIRLNPDGSIDTSFGTSGTIDVAAPMANSNLTPSTLALQADGKILVLADAVPSSAVAPASATRPVVFRFDSDGSPDAGFGVAGQVMPNPAGAFVVGSGLQPDGKIDISVSRGTLDWIEQLNPDGSADRKFGRGGKVAITLASAGRFHGGQILVDPAGRVLVAGVQEIGIPTGSGGVGSPGRAARDIIGVVRLTASGRRDPTFGQSGSAIVARQWVYYSLRLSPIYFSSAGDVLMYLPDSVPVRPTVIDSVLTSKLDR